MMRTGAQYLEAVRDGRRVMCEGELIDDLTTHPKTRGYAQQIAHFYDLHRQPEHQEQLTFVDESGVRRAKQWIWPKTKEQARERRLYTDYVFRQFNAGMWGRLPCSCNPVLMTIVDEPEVWEEQSIFGKGQPLADNIRATWQELQNGDLVISPMNIDLTGDRSAPNDDRPMLTMIEERDDGIVVEGWKAVNTGGVFADQIQLGVFWSPGTREEQVIYARVPVNAPGLTHLTRPCYAKPDATEYEYPFSSYGDELDAMAYFDNVFIPWKHVFHLGNIEHAKQYPQKVFDWAHIDMQIRHTVHAELLAGLGLLVTDALGTAQFPIVGATVADFVRFRETCRAFVIASEDAGEHTDGGLYKPDPTFVNFGRAYFTENFGTHVEKLVDLCGRGIMVSPTDADLDDPYLGPHLTKALAGTAISARDRTKIFKVIRDRYLSETGTRNQVFERLNGTPLVVLRFLTLQRMEYSVDGPMAELARNVCGVGDSAQRARGAGGRRKGGAG